jgi:hypothetical protein
MELQITSTALLKILAQFLVSFYCFDIFAIFVLILIYKGISMVPSQLENKYAEPTEQL